MPVGAALSLASGPRLWWWTGALLTGYLLVMLAGPTRACLWDGLRAMARYRELWLIPALLTVSYTTWELCVRVFYFCALPVMDKPTFVWWQSSAIPPGGWRPLLDGSVLPAVENLAGISAVLSTTYPLSALAGLLLLVNWRGQLRLLWRALWKRFRGWGAGLYLVILICALAAVAKPFTYAALPWWGKDSALALLRISLVIDWLSFLFQGLLGIGLQTYLILLAYLWVRGRNFTRSQLSEFAIRRFSVVLRWGWPVLLTSSLLLHGSYFLLTMRGPAAWMGEGWRTYVVDGAIRPCLAVALLAFFAVEITLIFHSESLRHACRDNFRFLRAHWFAMMFFVSIAFFHFFTLTVLGAVADKVFGTGSLPGIALQYSKALLLAALGGWLLASWASLYHRLTPGRKLEKLP